MIKYIYSILLIFFLSFNISIADDVLNVGLFEYYPYVFINDNDEIDGYYKEILDLMFNDLDIKYEYELLSLQDALKKLESGDIDIVPGLVKNPQRERKFIYPDTYLGVETYGIYTKKDIEYGNLEELDNVSIGCVKGDREFEKIEDFLEGKNILVNRELFNDEGEVYEKLKNGEIDFAMLHTSNEKLEEFTKIYEFTSGAIYMALSSGEYLDDINKWLHKNIGEENKKTSEIHSKYFGDIVSNRYIRTNTIFFIVLISIVLMGLCIFYYPEIKKNNFKKKTIKELENDRFLVYYQPIVNITNNKIFAFEALIRKKGEDGKILSPFFFLKEIEENEMMIPLTYWIIKKVSDDYHKIKNNNLEENFYVSVNICGNQLEDEKFVNYLIKIVNKKKVKIAIELVESTKITNIEIINKALNKLKENNIKISIDDFGVEHSNLDILEKMTYNVIKLDRYFITNIEKSKLKVMVLKFLVQTSEIKNANIVIEGVEEKYQKDFIISMNEKNNIYIQGYYYSKPVYIDEISYISLDDK